METDRLMSHSIQMLLSKRKQVLICVCKQSKENVQVTSLAFSFSSLYTFRFEHYGTRAQNGDGGLKLRLLGLLDKEGSGIWLVYIGLTDCGSLGYGVHGCRGEFTQTRL